MYLKILVVFYSIQICMLLKLVCGIWTVHCNPIVFSIKIVSHYMTKHSNIVHP